MDKTRKSVRNARKCEDGIQNRISVAFAIYMVSIYPLIMNDRYFDITLTKYKAFEVVLCIYAVLIALAVAIDFVDGRRPFAMFGRKTGRLMSDWFMFAFIIANVIAWALSTDKLAAFTGEEGRRCGLQFMILVFVLYVCMGRTLELKKYVLPVFLIAGTVTCVIAVFQYIGMDFLGLREGVSFESAHIYISTFGNIDIYAGFLCVVIAAALGLGLYAQKHWIKVILCIALFAGTAAVISTNADLTYAGVGAALVLAFLVAVYDGRLIQMVQMLLAMALGLLAVSILIGRSADGMDRLDGISKAAVNTRMAVCAVAVLACILVCIWLVKKFKPEMSERISGMISGKIPFLVCISLIAICLAGLMIYGISAGKSDGGSLFKFDDSWGTYRGYVWSRLWESYKNFPLVNKIFGYGNESVKAIMTSGYYDEMTSMLGVVYDNAHNEYLQYLVTVGALGVLAYIGLVISAFAGMIRCAFKNKECAEECIAIALGIAAYAVQALFNLNQSLTTPYMFLFIAMAAGINRRCRIWQEGKTQ